MKTQERKSLKERVTLRLLLSGGMLILLSCLHTCPLAAQTPVTDVGAGIQREALWTEEKGILSEIN
ncbi:MAG: hypothetical protein ACK5MA_08545, partial [Parachlamydiaceae bacterium]